MASEATRIKAVLLDGMGTLLRLVPPVPALAAHLGISEAVAARAFRAEVDYYLEHQLEASDPPSLADLRRRCADVLADTAGVAREGALEALMASIRFQPFDDAAPALRRLREDGLRLVVVSNWDCSLPDVLAEVGLRDAVDGVVSSASVGFSKPDPGIFAVALRAAACAPAEALHVGDSLEADVEGARAAGLAAVHLDRGRGAARAGITSIASLAELPALLS